MSSTRKATASISQFNVKDQRAQLTGKRSPPARRPRWYSGGAVVVLVWRLRCGGCGRSSGGAAGSGGTAARGGGATHRVVFLLDQPVTLQAKRLDDVNSPYALQTFSVTTGALAFIAGRSKGFFMRFTQWEHRQLARGCDSRGYTIPTPVSNSRSASAQGSDLRLRETGNARPRGCFRYSRMPETARPFILSCLARPGLGDTN